jgi:hypothetical protein
MVAVVTVVTVLVILREEVGTRDCALQIGKLLEERVAEINIATVCEWVPPITPPGSDGIDDEWALRCVNRDELLPRERAGAVVESSLVPICEPPELPAVRTERGWGDEFLLPAEDGARFLVEFEVIVRDLEGGFAP